MPITAQQRKILDKQDDQTLAEWYCQLNRWRWPKELPDEEPPRVFGRERNDGRDIRWSVMEYIEARVGKILISRTWNKDMTDAEFQSFHRGERGPGTPYGNFCERRWKQWEAAAEARTVAEISASIVLDDILDAEYLQE